MEIITKYISDELLYSLGWTIFHSIWIGAVVSLLLFITLNIMNRSSARVRYNISVAALSILTVIIGFVFTRTLESSVDSQTLFSSAESNLAEDFTPLLQNGAGLFVAPELNYGISQTLISFLDRNYSLISMLWLIGMGIMIIRFAGGILRSEKMRRYGTGKGNMTLISISDKLSRKIGIRKKVEVIESIITKVPMTMGWLKPVIYVPLGTISGIPYNQIESIIAHELAHIKRNDYLINIIQSIVEIVMFYHPAVWWISSMIRSEREIACDDIAIEHSTDKLSYVKALLSISEISSDNMSAVAFTGNSKNLLHRIKRITKMTHPKIKRTDKWTSALMSLILVAAVLIVSGFSIDKTSGETLTDLEIAGENTPILNLSEVSAIPELIQDTINISGTIDRSITDPVDNKEKDAVFTFKNGKLTKLVIDGKAIPESDYHLYSELTKEVKDDLVDALVDMEDALVDIEEAMEEIENLDMEEIEFEIQEALKEIEEIDMEEIEFEIQEALKEIEEIDMEEIEFEIQEALKEIEEIDMEEIQLEMELALEEMEGIDMKEIELEMQKALEEIKELDIEKIKSEMMESLEGVKEIDTEKIMKEMEESMKQIEESLNNMEINYQQNIEDHKKNIEGQKKVLEKQLIEIQEQTNKQEEQIKETEKKKKKEKIS